MLLPRESMKYFSIYERSAQKPQTERNSNPKLKFYFNNERNCDDESSEHNSEKSYETKSDNESINSEVSVAYSEMSCEKKIIIKTSMKNVNSFQYNNSYVSSLNKQIFHSSRENVEYCFD